MNWLKDAPDDKRQLNWGNNFIRYEKKDNRIIATAASFTRRQERKYLLHTFFVFDLNEPKVQFDSIADLVKEQCENDLEDETKGFEDKMRELLYKMITFLDLIPLKLIRLPKWGRLENESSNEVKNIEPVYNNQNIPLTVVTVTANWNSSIYIEETNVKDHYKNVLYGKGKSKIRRRFVKGYPRSDHWRLAGKLRATSNTNLSKTNEVVKLDPKGVVTHKQISVTMKNPQKLGVQNGQPKQQESPNLFLEKLAELKKKFNKTG